jgi:O-antigen/teichoic acid export membrane protein
MDATPASDYRARQSERPQPGAGEGASPSLWRRIRRDALVLGAGNAALVLAQLGFRGILVAVLAPAAYGRLSLVLSIYNSAWIIGSSGLPNSVARYLAIGEAGDDRAIVRAALRAGALPIAVAAVLVATAAGVILHSPLAAVLGAIGLCCLIYTLLSMGILRGRGQMGMAASVMPTAGFAEFALLAILWKSGLAITPLSAFGVFALGNLIGLITAVYLVRRTSPGGTARQRTHAAPSARQLLGFSVWIAFATAGVAVLPLIMRAAAALDSFTAVAVIDVALILFSIPQRLGTVIVLATTPHASRQHKHGHSGVAISAREHFLVMLPFVAAAAIVAFTPLVGSLFDLLGRPEYDKSAPYLALALLAGPARILYGLVEGILIGRGEGRFLGLTATSISALASGLIFAAAALGSLDAAFAAFVLAFWLIYLIGLNRVRRRPDTAPSEGAVELA